MSAQERAGREAGAGVGAVGCLAGLASGAEEDGQQFFHFNLDEVLVLQSVHAEVCEHHRGRLA